MTEPNPSAAVTFNTDIERARHLIPGFLKKTLSHDDKEWMTQFLNQLKQQGGAEATEFTQEMAWVERSQLQLAQDAPAFDAQAGWQRLQGRLNQSQAAPSTIAKTSPKLSGLAAATAWVKTQVKDRIQGATAWWKKPAIGVLASAMIVAQMGLLAAAVKQISQMQAVSESVMPSSGAPSLSGMVVLAIVFKDNATLLDVRNLIDSVQGRVIDGPGALGVWQVAVPKDKLEMTLKQLGAATSVQSVEQQ